MKSIKYIVLFLLAGVIFFQSCSEDFFELTNPPEFPWLNVSEFERAAVSPYNYAFYSGWGGHFFMADRVVRDCMTDQVYRIPEASANYFIDPVYQRQTDINDGRNSQSFSAGYDAIGIINTALDFYYANDENPYPELSPQEKRENVDRIAGELHFMRAFSYMHQCYRHCPPPGTPKFSSEAILPLRINFTDAEAALNAEFVTTERIYEQILEDLKIAKRLLPKEFKEGIHHPSYQFGRVNKFVAHAFLSRVYFQLGEWELAEAEIDTVIEMNGGKYFLDQDPIEAFNRSDNSRGNEVIWQCVNYDETHGYRNSPADATLFTFLDYRALNGGLGEFYKRSSWHVFSMSNLIAQEIGWMGEDLSVTEEALRDKRYSQLFYRLEGNRKDLLSKEEYEKEDPKIYEMQYIGVKEPRLWGNKYFRAPDGAHSNVPVIRLAELYLTRSIIRFRNGDAAGAAADLNVVRARAWNEIVAGTSYESSDQYLDASSITEEIINKERIKELAYEGDRMIYLMALQEPIPPGESEATQNVEFPYDGLFWTIPQLEIDFKID